jgi:hypothetical protein
MLGEHCARMGFVKSAAFAEVRSQTVIGDRSVAHVQNCYDGSDGFAVWVCCGVRHARARFLVSGDVAGQKSDR